MGFLRGKAAAVCLAPPTFNLQPFLRLWADYVHGSLWADGAGSASRAGNVPFLNENQGGAGKKGPILLQIKSFTNDGKLVQIKTFFSSLLLPPTCHQRLSAARPEKLWVSPWTWTSSSQPSCSFSCFILRACRSASHSGTRWAEDAAGFPLSLT